jgi:hypothetical protein
LMGEAQPSLLCMVKWYLGGKETFTANSTNDCSVNKTAVRRDVKIEH